MHYTTAVHNSIVEIQKLPFLILLSLTDSFPDDLEEFFNLHATKSNQCPAQKTAEQTLQPSLPPRIARRRELSLPLPSSSALKPHVPLVSDTVLKRRVETGPALEPLNNDRLGLAMPTEGRSLPVDNSDLNKEQLSWEWSSGSQEHMFPPTPPTDTEAGSILPDSSGLQDYMNARPHLRAETEAILLEEIRSPLWSCPSPEEEECDESGNVNCGVFSANATDPPTVPERMPEQNDIRQDIGQYAGSVSPCRQAQVRSPNLLSPLSSSECCNSAAASLSPIQHPRFGYEIEPLVL